ncbi:MAG: DinB family protein, partial [Anaerolineae bacterium]|nr:DinB family protein [Anaerolineae bacterium]
RIEEHVAGVTAVSTSSGQAVFQSLSDEQLNWQPDPKEWSILQCFDHLNLTHAYYRPKIEAALQNPVKAKPDEDMYKPSFWGRIYMHFAFNPKYSFAAQGEMVPETARLELAETAVSRQVLETYLNKQTELLQTLDQCADVDLRHTPIPIATGVKFNLGDVLKVLVYHDELHFGQARGVLEQMDSSGATHV